MNSRQLEVQNVQAAAEQETLERLKKVYEQASRDCSAKIRELSMRTDMENLQTIIYQKQYQEALKRQIDRVLDDLNDKSFTTIAEYLTQSYENGFLGVLYDLQGQGIPLMFPMRQDEVTRAVQVDSKLSEPMYKRLGEDTGRLKKSIRAELSRGIANGSSWNKIAACISTGMNSPFQVAYNNSIRIARTEGHRVQNEAAYQCQQQARARGADIIKIWDATLDGKTRPHHIELDGQAKELDEPFEVAGKKAMYPGGFGDASEDCNCRCILIQQSRTIWGWDSGFTKMNNFTGEIMAFKNRKSYEEFKTGFFSKENRQYMNYVETLEKRYGTKDFRKILGSMTDREYRHYKGLSDAVQGFWDGHRKGQ